MESITPRSDKIIWGRNSCTKPTVMENSLYSRDWGRENRPTFTRNWFTMPLRPRMTIQLKERITGLVNSGNTASAIITPLCFE